MTENAHLCVGQTIPLCSGEYGISIGQIFSTLIHRHGKNATGTKESDFKIEFRLPPSPHRVVYYRRRIKNLSAAFFLFDTICDAANGKQQRTRRLCAAHALAEIFFLIEILLPSASDSAKNKRKDFASHFHSPRLSIKVLILFTRFGCCAPY